MLRIPSGFCFLPLFFAEVSEFVLSEIVCSRFVFSKFQDSEEGWATGLGMLGGMNVGEAPRSSAWRSFLARASSRDCGERVIRAPIWKLPLWNQPWAW